MQCSVHFILWGTVSHQLLFTLDWLEPELYPSNRHARIPNSNWPKHTHDTTQNRAIYLKR